MSIADEPDWSATKMSNHRKPTRKDREREREKERKDTHTHTKERKEEQTGNPLGDESMLRARPPQCAPPKAIESHLLV